MKVVIGITAVVSAIGLLITYFTPESPWFLYEKRNWDKLWESFTFIERVNKFDWKLEFQDKFDVEGEKEASKPAQRCENFKKFKNI